ncbi:MAG: type II/IV secretion system protein [Deltaproteobacteria bacterium]|nr:type II/IV secretion system protein [Deltaproteobacteria bacterium]
MQSGKMTVEYLVGVLIKQGLLSADMAEQTQKAVTAQHSRLTRLKARGTTPGKDADEEVSQVEALASLALPFPGGTGQTIDEEAIIKAVAKDVNLPYRKIDPLELDLDIVTKTLPRSFALKHLVVPVAIVGQTLEVAVCDPFNHMVLEDVRRVSEFQVTPVLSTKTDIKKLISEFYTFKSSIAGAEGQMAGRRLAVDLGNLEQYFRLKSTDEIQANDQHIKNAVDYIFGYAFEQRASDIHIEPKRQETLVRMRIDGMLHSIHRLPKVIHPAIISRIKTMSRLDIAEKRRPQDGRIKIDHQGHEAEVRVSTIPVAFGEKVVMRILDPDVLFRELKDLVTNEADFNRYIQFIKQPHGIILVTGPTGSGKSTTLYSTLRYLYSEAINVTTVEDPIEMIHEDFNQIAVQPLVGITFGSILRNILRQDPDVIMIGEMRDFDTVENAIQAALTGHLVLSTLHTNDAPSAVTRLIDIGAERFLVASTVIGIIAQRLLRRICPQCIGDIYLTPEQVTQLGLRIKSSGPIKLKQGQGCDKCRGTGYLGRLAALEVMPFSDRLRQMTMAGEEAKVLKKAARMEGMVTLRENALKMMIRGETTYQEVLRVTVED